MAQGFVSVRGAGETVQSAGMARLRILVLIPLLGAGIAAFAVLRSRGPAPPRPAPARHVKPAPPRPRKAAPPAVLHLPSPLPDRTLTLPILMYHRIDLLKPSLPALTLRLTVDPREFAR